jgi:hypothetical protein
MTHCTPVFLRLLEYFEGIMFLTTNRVTNFDAAFKSRIHHAIKYPELSHDSQRRLWMTFLTNNSQRLVPHWLDEAFLDNLANNMLNGRQIRNIARTATALAAAEHRELLPGDVHTSLDAAREFEKDFLGDVAKTHLGKASAMTLRTTERLFLEKVPSGDVLCTTELEGGLGKKWGWWTA